MSLSVMAALDCLIGIDKQSFKCSPERPPLDWRVA
jgi:hypothetical protein